MLQFPVCHWGGGRGVDFGNLQGPPYADQNRLVFEGTEAGAGNGKRGTCAFRFKLNKNLAPNANIGFYAQRNIGSGSGGASTADGAFITSVDGQNWRLSISFTSDFNVAYADHDALGLFSKSSFGLKGVWHSVCASWDLSAGALRLWVGETDEYNAAASFFLDQEIWYGGIISTLGCFSSGTTSFSFPAASHVPGCFEMFYLNIDSFIDFDIEENRRKFFSATGAAVDLGPTGEGPGLGRPLIYFLGPLNSFGVNKGSGGVFVHQGDGSLKPCS